VSKATQATQSVLAASDGAVDGAEDDGAATDGAADGASDAADDGAVEDPELEHAASRRADVAPSASSLREICKVASSSEPPGIPPREPGTP
jgi:hypothetical protein